MLLCALNVNIPLKQIYLCQDFVFSAPDFFCILHLSSAGISLDFDQISLSHMLLHCAYFVFCSSLYPQIRVNTKLPALVATD